MASLENIFDGPAEEVSNPALSRRPAAEPLFAPGSDDDEPQAPSASKSKRVRRPASPPVQNIDFSNFYDGDGEDASFDVSVPEPVDVDAVRRRAERQARAALPSSPPQRAIASSSPVRGGDGGDKSRKSGKKDELKEKRKPMRLDENRLLSQDGFPALIKATKGFKVTGKGHEAADLNRLIKIYQFWTHQLYPKTPFPDTVDRVEKLCHTKRMHVALSVWKDESQGKQPQSNLFEDDMDVDDDAQEEEPRDPPRPSSSMSSRPPSSLGTSENDEPSGAPPSGTRRDEEQEFEDAMWAEFAEAEEQLMTTRSIPASNSNAPAEDDEWAILAEMEASAANSNSSHLAPEPPGDPFELDDMDMYHDE